MFTILKLLAPALIPSWRFFRTVEPSPRVQWRFCGAESDQDWQDFRPRPDHVSLWEMLLRLLWNPHWNETLYSVSLAERLTEDPTSHAQSELFRLIAAQVPQDTPAQAIAFRLRFVTRETSEITYQSAPCPIADIRHEF